MPFLFLKYLQPTHYFRVFKKDGMSVFPLPDALPEEILKQLSEDKYYESDQSVVYDISWQAIQKGYVGDAKTYLNFKDLPIRDNYHFSRKYFHKVWVFYVLILRIVSFHNPIREILGWYQTRGVKRQNFTPFQGLEQKWQNYHSSLVKSNPKISVVIPTLNRYEYLKMVLKDFEAQDYSNFEIIVVDQSDDFNASFYSTFDLNIKLIRQEEKALWLARNTAIQASIGEFIALSEDDVRIPTHWISSHIKCLDYYNAKISAGVFYPEGQHIPKERSFFTLASQFATGNAILHKSVFYKVGLFDRQFEKQRMGDGEFGMRTYLNGIKSVSNPVASCVDIKAGTGGLREMGSWDAFRPSNFFSPRPIPSVLYFYRRYFGNKNARLALLKTVPISILPYQFKKNKIFLILGFFLSILISPLVLLQVWRSWRLATLKIKHGPIIPDLK